MKYLLQVISVFNTLKRNCLTVSVKFALLFMCVF